MKTEKEIKEFASKFVEAVDYDVWKDTFPANEDTEEFELLIREFLGQPKSDFSGWYAKLDEDNEGDISRWFVSPKSFYNEHGHFEDTCLDFDDIPVGWIEVQEHCIKCPYPDYWSAQWQKEELIRLGYEILEAPLRRDV